jgi:hypothetical protein
LITNGFDNALSLRELSSHEVFNLYFSCQVYYSKKANAAFTVALSFVYHKTNIVLMVIILQHQ